MISLLLTVLVLAQTSAGAPADCPMHAKHMSEAKAKGDAKHGAEVDSRHDTFGMPHEGVRHSFRLYSDGGVIELQSIAGDAEVARVIRGHLREIRDSFAKGDFEKPLFVHGRMPDGTHEMAAKGEAIEYRFEELPRGGKVRMRTSDTDALDAIHRFLRFQVVEHRTGDTGKIEETE